jgi:UDP-N-acetylglucosamine--N-acetylmuramyl-(pentapeptide) pyrophosphoryl-undecaprenol N-acetylglucosamine transferase
MEQKRIIISGGGTGGHIFPALAIADGLKERLVDPEILFVGAIGKMEMEKVPAAGFRIVGLPVMGFPRKPGIRMVKFLTMLFKSSRKARQVLKEFNPDIAVGVGGFASGPVLRAAAKKGIPVLIQEQNSYAGITNKLLAKKAAKICVAYEDMDRFFPSEKIVMTGNPVRGNILNYISRRDEALFYFNLNSEDKVVLIIGGSLGARSVNDAVLKNIEAIRKSEAKIIWQTGSIYYDEMIQKTLENKPENLQIHKFLVEMDKAFGAANVIISRAGAGTISELCLVGKPAILVPSPNVAEDHQTKNAMALVEKDAALMVRDDDIDSKLFETVFGLMNDEKRGKQLSENIKKLAKPNATKSIVDEIVGIIE